MTLVQCHSKWKGLRMCSSNCVPLLSICVHMHTHTHTYLFIYTRWFKYDWDCLCVNLATSVPVIFEPPCIYNVCVCISQSYIYAEYGTIDLLTIYIYVCVCVCVCDSYNLQCCVYASNTYIYSLNFNVCHAIVLLIV